MSKNNKRVYNLQLDPKLVKRLDHLKIDVGISRQQLIQNCLEYVLGQIKKDKRVKRRIRSTG
jgi:peptidyl-tRNA hydrolase